MFRWCLLEDVSIACVLVLMVWCGGLVWGGVWCGGLGWGRMVWSGVGWGHSVLIGLGWMFRWGDVMF